VTRPAAFLAAFLLLARGLAGVTPLDDDGPAMYTAVPADLDAAVDRAFAHSKGMNFWLQLQDLKMSPPAVPPAVQRKLDALRDHNQTGPVARNLAEAFLRWPEGRRWVADALLHGLGQDWAQDARPVLLPALKPGCDPQLVDLLWFLAPMDEDFHAGLAALVPGGSEVQQAGVANIITACWERGHRCPALDRALDQLELSGTAKVRDCVAWVLKERAKGPADAWANARSADFSKRRAALMDLARRYEDGGPDTMRLLKALADAREAWKGRLSRPPFTPEEWGELAEANPEVLGLALRQAGAGLLDPKLVCDLVGQGRLCGQKDGLQARMAKLARQLGLSQGPGTGPLLLALQLDPHDPTLLIRAEAAYPSPSGGQGGFPVDLILALESSCVDPCADPGWKAFFKKRSASADPCERRPGDPSL
jgi:hypothetical protein